MKWFYNLSLLKKLVITPGVLLALNLCLGIFALLRLGDTAHIAETGNVLIGLMLVSTVVSCYLTYFIYYKVVCRSLCWVTRLLERVADGDLTQNIQVKSTEEIGQIIRAIKKISDKLEEVGSHMNELIHTLADRSKSLLQTTAAMNVISHEQTAETDKIASSIMEMSQTFNDVAGNAEEASRISKDSAGAAQQGFETVSDVMAEVQRIVKSVEQSSVTIAKLGDSSRKIGDIVATIEEVADMTNLLALNAAIEAARAGEHGRGFAVVADEVRALAERTGKATREITQMIKSIQFDTQEAVSSMMSSRSQADDGLVKAEEAGRALEQIVDVSGRSMEMIQQIAVATEQQSAVAHHVSTSIESIARNSRSTGESAGEIQESAGRLAQLSEELEQTAAWFRA
ncbi:MAG: methyl-accepting chemotaxis protein [Deltaproteobacteria bacterium]|nr:methyl-accepting chemotaxis protein [Deltaproteobacteria bacterium]